MRGRGDVRKRARRYLILTRLNDSTELKKCHRRSNWLEDRQIGWTDSVAVFDLLKMVGTFEDDVRGKGGRNSWSYGGNGPSRKSRENQLKKRWTGDRESHPWWMRDSEGNIDPSKPAVHFVHDDEVHAASEGSASTPDNSIRDTIWKDDNGTSRRSRVGKGEDARGGGGGGREGREKDFRTRHLRGDSGSSRYHGYMHSSWQLHNENNHQYSAQYLGSSSSFSSPPQLQTETPVDNQKSLSSTIEVFRRHDDAVELEFFIKAAIACAVLMGFLLWFSVKFWCITKARRGQRRAGRGLQHNNRRYVCCLEPYYIVKQRDGAGLCVGIIKRLSNGWSVFIDQLWYIGHSPLQKKKNGFERGH